MSRSVLRWLVRVALAVFALGIGALAALAMCVAGSDAGMLRQISPVR